MADNYLITEGSSRAMGADEITSVLYPRIKLIFGPDGTNSGDVSDTNPLPIKITDGTTIASVRDCGSNDALNVALTDASGNHVALSITEYTEDAAAAANPVGSMLLSRRRDTLTGAEVSTDGDVIAVNSTSKGELYVKQTDAVTVNAGTNLNTSALALESGGNLATIAGAIKTEDLASADAHAGIGALAVRKATPANTSGTDGDYEFLQMSAGRLWTSATIDAALPAGTNAIGKLTANSGVIIGDVNVVSSTLPSGAATSAKQPALGTAGTASADVITVQGIASMTALKVDGSAVNQPVTDAGGSLTVDGTITVGNSTGGSAVNIQDGGNSITVDGTITANAGTNLNTSALALESGGNLATIAGAIKTEDLASADAHAGIGALAVRKATPANTSGTDGDYEFLQMSAGRLWTSAVIDTALPAGTNAIGKLAANSGVDIGDIDVTSVVPGTSASSLGKAEDAAAGSGDTGIACLFVRRDTIASSTNTDGDYAVPSVTDLGELYAQITASAKNGYTMGKLISASGNNKTQIKGSAGTLGFLTVSNTNASARYLKIYNVASASVTVGTTVPDLTFLIPGNASGAGSNIPIPTQGLAFGTAITIALTTGAADNDSGSVAASEILVNYGYK